MPLHHVAISVKDIERSIAFYRDALGMTVFQDEVISGPDVDMALMETDGHVRMVLLLNEAGNMVQFHFSNLTGPYCALHCFGLSKKWASIAHFPCFVSHCRPEKLNLDQRTELEAALASSTGQDSY